MHSRLKEIGGYFELELLQNEQFYPNLIALNSGRSCLEYILRAGGYSKIFLPYYICDVVLEPIHKLGIKIVYYSIKDDFTIKESFHLVDKEVLLYVNYFGLKDDYIQSLTINFNNLIIDNAQAFYSKPLDNVITYYSPRKYFGVSDGGYLSTKKFLDIELEKDISHNYANFLLQRIDRSAEAGYEDFRKNEVRLSSVGIKRISELTTKILSSIDYNFVKERREDNFRFIHEKLGTYNKLKFVPEKISGPMVYPFLSNNSGLRDFLISKKVFIAKYWDNITQMCPEGSFENILATQLVALPVDQRYGITEMSYIITLVKSYLKL